MIKHQLFINILLTSTSLKCWESTIINIKTLSLKALNDQELAYIFRSDPWEEKTANRNWDYSVSHSHCVPSLVVQLFYFGGRSLLFWSSYATQQACTCNVSMCYVLWESRASEGTHPLPNNIQQEEHVHPGLAISTNFCNANCCEIGEGAQSLTFPPRPSSHFLHAKIFM